ncbi:MAG: hypothetical protein HYV99_07015 [Betaproteobacteria bacterium]|nr:hypothetical protein [Betaproteobacteria bacterium]
MTQNINLLAPAFRKQRQLLSLARVAQCLALVLFVLAAYHYYLREQVGGLAEELASAERLLKTQRSYSDRLKGQSAGRKADTRLEAEIARLETELKQGREAMEALKGGAFGNQQGFAEYLRAFSRQSVSGLWLTGFTIAGSGELEIRGRVVAPDLVPGYIQRLNREKVLAGRSFAKFEMSRPPAGPEADKGKDAKKTQRAARFLEFSLATADVAKAGKAQ